MARKVSPFKIGLLIIICGSLGLTAIIWLGTSHMFEERKRYASYFNESVKGLQKDAVVDYRGVAVGRVAGIGLAPDSRLVEVLMDLKPDFKVDRSLDVQIREQGLTGLRYLEIDKAPDDIEKVTPHLDFQPKYPVIPSYPSEFVQLKNALQTLYDKIYSLNINNLANNWERTADLLNGFLVKLNNGFDLEQWKQTMTAVNKTAKDTSQVMERISKATPQEVVNKNMKDLTSTLQATRLASESLANQLKGLPPDTFAKTIRSWDTTVATGGTLFSNADMRLAEAANALQQNTQQLNLLLTHLTALVQELKEQPNRLIFPPRLPSPFERK